MATVATRPTPRADSGPSVPVLTCPCSACLALRAEYASDPELLAHCGRKLLKRGWAGTATPTEKAYIRTHADWAQKAIAKIAGKGFQARADRPNLTTETVHSEGVVPERPRRVDRRFLWRDWAPLSAPGGRAERPGRVVRVMPPGRDAPDVR